MFFVEKSWSPELKRKKQQHVLRSYLQKMDSEHNRVSFQLEPHHNIKKTLLKRKMSVHASNDTECKELLGQARSQGKKTVIKFGAAWCGPCRVIAPKFDELATMYKNTLFLSVDTDECEGFSGICRIRSLPTFLFLNEQGQVISQVVGADPAKLLNEMRLL